MSPEVSIIVPVYNIEKYIGECIKSLVSQTYRNIEILLIDDGSEDDSREICKSWERKDPRIKVLMNAHNGVSVARNTGIENASGKWISFVDGDDKVREDMIEKLAEAINPDTDIVIGCYDVGSQSLRENSVEHFFEGDSLFYPNKNEKDYKDLTKEAILGHGKNVTNVGVPWGKIYKKKFLDDNYIRFVTGLRRMQDTIFNVCAFNKASEIKYIDIPVYDYQLRKGSATMTYDPEFHKTALRVIGLLRESLDQIGDRYFVEEIMYAKGISLLMEIIRLELVPSEAKKIPYKKKKKLMKEYTKSIIDKQNYSKDINGIYLTRKQRIAGYFIACGQEGLLYRLLSMKKIITDSKRY